MFSGLIKERINNLQNWVTDRRDNQEEITRGEKSLFVTWSELPQLSLRDARGLSSEEIAILDLLVDFLRHIVVKSEGDDPSLREFFYYLRDRNSDPAFPDSFEIKFIELCFESLLQLMCNKKINGVKFDDLSKIQKILAVESFLKLHLKRFYDENVRISLEDIFEKTLVITVKAPGDEQLYLDNFQENLIEFFQDYDLNCILTDESFSS